MSLLNTKIKPRLQPGKYEIKINSVKEFENEKGGYVQLDLQFPDRTIAQNFFPSNLHYLGRCLSDQLHVAEEVEIELADLINEAIENHRQLFAIVSYNDYGLNIALHEPKTTENSEEVDFS